MREFSSEVDERYLAICRKLIVWFAAIVVLVACVSLTGWVLDVRILTKIYPTLPSMQPNTAVGLILCASALSLCAGDTVRIWRRVIIGGISLFVVSFSTLTMGQYILSVDLGIDQALVRIPLSLDQPHPGRPSPQTALNFILIGAALAARSIKNPDRWICPVQILAATAGANAMVAATGFIFSTSAFYGLPLYIPAIGMAVHSAACFLMLSAGIMCLRPSEGVMRIFAGAGQTARLARRLLLATIAVPSIAGLLSRIGVDAGLYGQRMQISLFSLLVLAGFLVIVWTSLKRSALEESALEFSRAALARSEEKYRGLLEGAYHAIITVNRSGRIVYVNPQVCNWFGYLPEELLGQPVEILIPERFRDTHVSMRNRFLSDPTARPMGENLDLYGRHKSGREFPVDIALSPSRSAEGIMVTAVIRDLTETKRHVLRMQYLARVGVGLSESLEFGDAVRAIAVAIVPEIADGCTLRVLEADRLCLKVTAFHDAEQEEKFAACASDVENEEIKPVELRRATDEHVSTLISGEMNIHKIETSEGRSMGEIFAEFCAGGLVVVPMLLQEKVIGTLTFLFSGEGVRPVQGDVPFFEAVAAKAALSIENARLFGEATRAVSAREEVLAVVSHDLKNPLATIKFGADLLYGERADEDTFQKIVRKIRNATGQMDALINDLADFTRIEGGVFSVEKHEQDFSEVLAPVIDYAEMQAKANGQTLEVDIPRSLRKVNCDGCRIRQVVSNLIGNALKFTPPKGKIVLRATDGNDGYLRIEVADSGPGIPLQHQKKVFERGWQAEQARHMGSGFGLYIAKSIVEAHGGNISVRSTPGEGSVFTFRIPLGELPQEQERRAGTGKMPGKHPQDRSLEGLTILLVEDALELSDLMRRVLERAGAHVTPAADADQAMRCLESEKPDLVLTDIELPGSDGFELLRKVRHLPAGEGREIPVAALTGTEAGSVSGENRDGFAAYLSKDLGPEQVVDAVSRIAQDLDLRGR